MKLEEVEEYLLAHGYKKPICPHCQESCFGTCEVAEDIKAENAAFYNPNW